MPTLEDQIVEQAAAAFPSFGGGRVSDFNSVTHWTKDKSPMFAPGVDIRSVVRFVLERAEPKPKTSRKGK